MASTDDRRNRPRVALHWPVRLFRQPEGKSIESTTENLSSQGLYCIASEAGRSQVLIGASVNGTVAPYGSLLIESTSASNNTLSGWANILSSSPLTGYGVFHYGHPSGSQSEGTIPFEVNHQPTFILPYENTDQFVTGVALTNLLANQKTDAIATVWDEDGNEIAVQTVSLPANGHNSFVLTDKFPATTGTRGMIEFRSSNGAPISGLGLRVSPAGGFTSVPKLSRPQ
jgi:hypothetical protein